jgi:inosine-uridine nucleoside N-ribohydrolase
LTRAIPTPVPIHLDTDLGGDTDDACALALLLGRRDVDLLGITTAADPGGRRAGYVRHVLELAGRGDVPVVAGAERSLSTLGRADPVVGDERHWPAGVPVAPAAAGAAARLLERSVEQGATIVAIGPLTNLAMLEVERPGSLGRVRVVAVAGVIDVPASGLPPWGAERDWNVQWDMRAAEIVAATANLTLVPLPVTLRAHVRASHLPRLRRAGALGRLLAQQAEAHDDRWDMRRLGRAHVALPDDLLNFNYDAVACAVAVGAVDAVIERRRLRPVREGDLLRFVDEQHGRPAGVVTAIDADGLAESWLTAVAAAGVATPQD